MKRGTFDAARATATTAVAGGEDAQVSSGSGGPGSTGGGSGGARWAITCRIPAVLRLPLGLGTPKGPLVINITTPRFCAAFPRVAPAVIPAAAPTARATLRRQMVRMHAVVACKSGFFYVLLSPSLSLLFGSPIARMAGGDGSGSSATAAVAVAGSSGTDAATEAAAPPPKPAGLPVPSANGEVCMDRGGG